VTDARAVRDRQREQFFEVPINFSALTYPLPKTNQDRIAILLTTGETHDCPEQWKRIEPHLPTDVRGVQRVDDRRVISGIVHVLKSGSTNAR
jgi:hypothetical protein